MDFTYRPVERYRAIMALLFFFPEGKAPQILLSQGYLKHNFQQGSNLDCTDYKCKVWNSCTAFKGTNTCTQLIFPCSTKILVLLGNFEASVDKVTCGKKMLRYDRK